MSGAGTANVTPHNVTRKPLPQDHSIDFLLTMDCLHDMAHPDTVATVIRAAIRPDGLRFIADVEGAPGSRSSAGVDGEQGFNAYDQARP